MHYRAGKDWFKQTLLPSGVGRYTVGNSSKIEKTERNEQNEKRAFQTCAAWAEREKAQQPAYGFILTISFAAVLVTLCITGSIIKTNAEYRLNTYGAWYGAIPYGIKGDAEFLSTVNGIGEIGAATVYGQAVSKSGVAVTSVGSADGNLLKIGRIELQDGELPQHDGEIALEASALSKLGKNYTIGQEIDFTVLFDAESEESVEGIKIPVECTFTLCGVLREYSSLWQLSENKLSKPVCGALITNTAGENLRTKAIETAAQMNEQSEEGAAHVSVAAANRQFFFEVDEAERGQAAESINAYMQKTRRGTNADKAVCINTAAFSDKGEANYHSFYICLILAVTVIAVVCIYAVQLRKQVRGIALFRSIGITKRQLRLLLTFETLILCLPALGAGTLLGTIITKLILKLFVYAKSAPVQVDVPLSQLAVTALCWIAGIFAARMAVFRIALSEPLTGRMHTARRRAHAFDVFRRTAVVLLAAVFCGAVIFGILESLYPRADMHKWQNQPAYVLNAESSEVAFIRDGRNAQLITADMLKTYQSIPGVTKAAALNSMTVELTFDGDKNSSLFTALREYDPQFEDGAAVCLYALSKESLGTLIDPSAVDAAAWQAFSNGEGVIMSFPVGTDGGVFFNREHFGAADLSAGDEISVGCYGSKLIREEDAYRLGAYSKLLTKNVSIAAVAEFDHEKTNLILTGAYQPYTVFCSDEFLKNILTECEPGSLCGSFITGDKNAVEAEYGCNTANVYTDLNAGYVSTDSVLAEITAKQSISMNNNREQYAAYIQEDLQKLILIYSGCGCIALVMLLLIGNILTLEAEGEEREFGILRALGMSKRQLRWQLNCRAALRGAAAVLCGWLVYAAYMFASAISRYNHRQEVNADMNVLDFVQSGLSGLAQGGANALTVVLITVSCAAILILLSRAAKHRLTRNDLAAMLRGR